MKDHHTVEIFWSDEDKGFIAFVHELEGCSAWGETREAALREVETAIELWIESAKEIGRPIPLPPSLSPKNDHFLSDRRYLPGRSLYEDKN